MVALYACCVMRIVLSMLNITYYEIGSVSFSILEMKKPRLSDIH